MPGSYGPDNGPVQAQVSGNRVTLTQPRDAAGLEKQITVTLAETGTGVTIGHRLTNRTPWPLDLAAWALTIMNGGGMVIIPNEPYKSHDEALLPDARHCHVGLHRPVRPTLDASAASTSGCAPTPALNAPQKIGVANRRGLGRLPPDRHAVRQAGGLGRHRRVPGLRRQHRDLHLRRTSSSSRRWGRSARCAAAAAATHEERWSLFKGVSAGTTEASLDAALQPLVAQTK